MGLWDVRPSKVVAQKVADWDVVQPGDQDDEDGIALLGRAQSAWVDDGAIKIVKAVQNDKNSLRTAPRMRESSSH